MRRALWIIFYVASVGLAQTPQDVFERANQLYRDGDIHGALSHYESIINQGYADASIYYNIGNCHYRLGNVAQAILAYERALRLAPGDADIEHNLALANARTQDRIESLPELFFVSWVRASSRIVPHTMARDWFVALWGVFFVSLGWYVLAVRESFLRLARIAAVVSLIGGMIVGTICGLQSLVERGEDEAIVVKNVVTVKSSPDAQSMDAFVVHEGLKVHVGDQIGEWVRITLADGKVGWVRLDEVEKI